MLLRLFRSHQTPPLTDREVEEMRRGIRSLVPLVPASQAPSLVDLFSMMGESQAEALPGLALSEDPQESSTCE